MLQSIGLETALNPPDLSVVWLHPEYTELAGIGSVWPKVNNDKLPVALLHAPNAEKTVTCRRAVPKLYLNKTKPLE